MGNIAQFAERRKLILRLVVSAIVLTLAVIAGSYWLGRNGSGDQVAPVLPVAKDVRQQASGYTFTRSDAGRQVFTIRATRTVAFKEGGSTVLEGVEVEVFGKDGNRRDLLRTSRCDYNTVSGDFFSSGNVEIELNAPVSGAPPGPIRQSIMLETSKLHFRQQGSVVESDQPVKFRYGAISGSAVGLSYATREGRLELKSSVQAQMQSDSGDALPMTLTASRARFEKESHVVNLAGPVEFAQGLRRAAASSAVIFLDETNRLKRAIFDGQVRATDQSGPALLRADAGRLTVEFEPGSESLRRAFAENDVSVESRRGPSVSGMNSEKMEILFAGTPGRAQRGKASGRVNIQQVGVAEQGRTPAVSASAGKLPAAHRALMTEEIEFTFQNSGRGLKTAATTSSARLAIVPADPMSGQRQVTAGRILMDFDEQSRLNTIRGEGGTTIYFVPGKDAPAGSVGPTSASDRLLATIDPATETVRVLDQIGNFHFYDGDRQATADQASYQTSNELLTLTGNPQVWDTEMRARANKILMDMASGRAEGLGKVQSTHTGGTAGGGDATSVLADRVVAERGSQTVRYEGHVRAWRGADVVESAALEIFRAERRVSSGTKVLTSHMQPAAAVSGEAAKKGQSLTRPATIRADHLEYFDRGRKAAYRGNVRMQTENTTLEADGLDAYFRERGGASELDRAVARGSVKVTQPGRRATGNQAEYFSADGKIVLTGGPPTLHDAEKGFTSGQSLTFYSRDDRLTVSGGDQSATVSRHRIGQ